MFSSFYPIYSIEYNGTGGDNIHGRKCSYTHVTNLSVTVVFLTLE